MFLVLAAQESELKIHEAAMADLNTKLKNTEEKLQSANKKCRDVVKLAKMAFTILSVTISIIGLAIAYQYFCDQATISELNTKLNTSENKMQAANKCKSNHYASLL